MVGANFELLCLNQRNNLTNCNACYWKIVVLNFYSLQCFVWIQKAFSYWNRNKYPKAQFSLSKGPRCKFLNQTYQKLIVMIYLFDSNFLNTQLFRATNINQLGRKIPPGDERAYAGWGNKIYVWFYRVFHRAANKYFDPINFLGPPCPRLACWGCAWES